MCKYVSRTHTNTHKQIQVLSQSHATVYFVVRWYSKTLYGNDSVFSRLVGQLIPVNGLLYPAHSHTTLPYSHYLSVSPNNFLCSVYTLRIWIHVHWDSCIVSYIKRTMVLYMCNHVPPLIAIVPDLLRIQKHIGSRQRYGYMKFVLNYYYYIRMRFFVLSFVSLAIVRKAYELLKN